jgi:dCMP deaminase
MQETIVSSTPNKWNNHFLEIALLNAKMSKDPSTKVGAIITTREHDFISAGFNGLPRKLKDTEERLNNRELKLKLVVHAEMNSILAAAKLGIKLNDCTMYIAATNNDGSIWGGPPCSRCLVEILQTGITKIVTYNRKQVPSRWKEDLDFSMSLIDEAKIQYEELEYDWWQN